MQILRLIALAFLAGSIGAGAVWYGWGLVENAKSLVQNRSAHGATEAEEVEDDGDATPAEAEKALT